MYLKDSLSYLDCSPYMAEEGAYFVCYGGCRWRLCEVRTRRSTVDSDDREVLPPQNHNEEDVCIFLATEATLNPRFKA